MRDHKESFRKALESLTLQELKDFQSSFNDYTKSYLLEELFNEQANLQKNPGASR